MPSHREIPAPLPLKVAFIGTHGVGKTTLCYELAAKLKKRHLDADIVTEVARSCPLPINQTTNAGAQRWILHTQIAQEIELEARARVVVCDRSVLDNYAYHVASAGRDVRVEQVVRGWLPTYGLLLRVPPRGRISRDGVRDTDPHFQVRIDQVIGGLLKEWRIEVVDLGPLSRPRWIGAAQAAVLAWIRGEELPQAGEAPEPQMDLF